MDEARWAYIAGFLDGDGSIILQLKPRRDYRFGFQIKATVSFFQSNAAVLRWLEEVLPVGRLRRRKDGIWEYNIEGIEPVAWFLRQVQPYVVAKRPQVEEALQLLEEMLTTKPTPQQFFQWAQRVESYQALNYSKKRKYTAADVERFLSSKGLLPPP